MNEETFQRVKTACEKFIAEGGSIVTASWGVRRDERGQWYCVNGTKCACAFGAFMLTEQPPVEDNRIDVATAEALGVPLSKVDSFVEGFDQGDEDQAEDIEWYRAGERLRSELLGY